MKPAAAAVVHLGKGTPAAKCACTEVYGSCLQLFVLLSDAADSMCAPVLQVQDAGPGRRLQQVCELVGKALRDAGLPGDSRPLKLHATLINTRWACPQARSYVADSLLGCDACDSPSGLH